MPRLDPRHPVEPIPAEVLDHLNWDHMVYQYHRVQFYRQMTISLIEHSIAVYCQARALPEGPERKALFRAYVEKTEALVQQYLHPTGDPT
jgi:hypothetical protein